jgi:hypothetical protein
MTLDCNRGQYGAQQSLFMKERGSRRFEVYKAGEDHFNADFISPPPTSLYQRCLEAFFFSYKANLIFLPPHPTPPHFPIVDHPF